MKIYISADIEEITGATHWDQATLQLIPEAGLEVSVIQGLSRDLGQEMYIESKSGLSA